MTSAHLNTPGACRVAVHAAGDGASHTDTQADERRPVAISPRSHLDAAVICAAIELAFLGLGPLAPFFGRLLETLGDYLRLRDFRFDALPTPISTHTLPALLRRKCGRWRIRSLGDANRCKERSRNTNKQSLFEH